MHTTFEFYQPFKEIHGYWILVYYKRTCRMMKQVIIEETKMTMRTVKISQMTLE